MNFRTAFPEDIPELMTLLEALFSLEADFEFDAPKARDGLCQLLNRPTDSVVWVAESQGRVVGMCTAQIIISTAMGAPAAWIEDVVLLPEFRGQGWMPLLMGRLEEWCRLRGVGRLQVLCDLENPPALAFYPKQGFRRTQLICFHKPLTSGEPVPGE